MKYLLEPPLITKRVLEHECSQLVNSSPFSPLEESVLHRSILGMAAFVGSPARDMFHSHKEFSLGWSFMNATKHNAEGRGGDDRLQRLRRPVPSFALEAPLAFHSIHYNSCPGPWSPALLLLYPILKGLECVLLIRTYKCIVALLGMLENMQNFKGQG